ncbi:MAG: SOS response-associated peptidase [Bacteroidetes bacterium]|nr:SOS response-associated peptidase [Bacteroidota bacterium]
MCYDIKTKVEAALKRARRYNNEEWTQMLIDQFRPFLENEYFHVSGFEHPELLIYTKNSFDKPIKAVWGLIPFWVKNSEQQLKTWNNTINARGETIFEKPSFRSSAKSKRCLIYIDGFFEHHYFNGESYPFFVQKEDKEPLIFGGLWDEWVNNESGELITSCTIITTKANALMSKIHNNPRLKESRMPLILKEKDEDEWLNGDLKDANNLIVPASDIHLKAHTVRKLRGNNSVGNSPKAVEEYIYPVLKFTA